MDKLVLNYLVNFLSIKVKNRLTEYTITKNTIIIIINDNISSLEKQFIKLENKNDTK